MGLPPCSVLYLSVVAVDYLHAVVVPVVHTVAQAVLEYFAVFAHTFACPLAIAEGLESVLPHLVEAVFVDVALSEGLAVDIGAGAYCAIDQH